jgi:hypothetical protein
MASTYSALKIELIGTGDQTGTWGNTTNVNLGDSALGEAITGSADVAFSSADVTITLVDTNATQSARNLRLNLTGTSGGARNLILGSGCQIEKLYLVNNGLADAVTVKNTTGTGIAVAAGKTMFVYNNGTNVVDAITHLTSLTTGVLSASGATTFTAGTASTSTTTGTAVITGGLGVSGRVNAANFDGIVGANTAAAGSFTTINASTSITNAGLTSGRVTFAGASGLLSDSANLTFDGTNLLLNAANPNVQGTSSTGSATLINNSGGAFVRVYGGSHATKANFTELVNGSTTSTIDSGGNLGLGVTPAPFATVKAIQLNTASTLMAFTNEFDIGQNVYYNAGNKYITTGAATLYAQSAGAHGFYTSASGTAGNAITFYETLSLGTSVITISADEGNIAAASSIRFRTDGSEKMRLDLDGNLGIGTSSPSGRLHLATSGTSNYMQFTGSATASSYIQMTNTGGIFTTGINDSAGSTFGGPAYSGNIYMSGAYPMVFWTSGAERMRIDSSGNLLVGTTTNASGTPKVAVNGSIQTLWGQIRVATVFDNSFRQGLYFDSTARNMTIFSTTSDSGGNILFSTRNAVGSSDADYGTERMRIDSSGNVGIGTNSPKSDDGGNKLEISNSANTVVTITATNDTTPILNFRSNAVDRLSILSSSSYGANFLVRSNQDMRFGTNSTERMRIDSNGNVGINTSSANTKLGINGASSTISGYTPQSFYVTQSSGDMVAGIRNSHPSNPYGMQIAYTGASPNSTENEFLQCVDSGPTVRIQLRSNGGIGNYSANNVNLSDERTKKDIKIAPNYLSKICAIPVRTFLYKDQTNNELNLGVIAQEVEKVAPELIDNSGFGETPEDGIPLKTIYQTDLQYALMKCIQEQQALIESLTTRLTALEN